MPWNVLEWLGRGMPGMKRQKIRPRHWVAKRKARQAMAKASRRRNRPSWGRPKRKHARA